MPKMKTPESHWNYRIIRRATKQWRLYGVHEVYYTKWIPHSWSKDPMFWFFGNTKDIIWDLKLMLKNANRDVKKKTILDYAKLCIRHQPTKRELFKRLKESKRVCSECWDKYWKMPEWHLSTRHDDTCDICLEFKSCTEPRDFLYFKKTLDAQERKG